MKSEYLALQRDREIFYKVNKQGGFTAALYYIVPNISAWQRDVFSNGTPSRRHRLFLRLNCLTVGL